MEGAGLDTPEWFPSDVLDPTSGTYELATSMFPFWMDFSFSTLVELMAAMGTVGWLFLSFLGGGRA